MRVRVNELRREVISMGNRILGTRAAAIAAAGVLMTMIGCGSNTTPVGIVVTPSTPTVQLKGSQQFSAAVTGSATQAVTWQICLPPTTAGTQPTVCNPVVTGMNQTQLPAGYGTITSGANGIGGGLYTAPATAPPTNGFFVVATSTQDTTAFGTATVDVISNITVAVHPNTATMQVSNTFQFTAVVNGTSNQGVTWSVTGSDNIPVVGGNSTLGYICPSVNLPASCTPGEYFAPAISPGSVTITAASSSDPTISGTAAVTIGSGAANPTVTLIQPNLVSEGSAQQEVYITGTNFFTTSSVLVGTPPTAVPSLYLTATLIRATLPAGVLQTAGNVPIVVQQQSGDVSNTLGGIQGLVVTPTRPAIVAAIPDTLVPALLNTNINLVGGFFSPSSAVQVNGQAVGATLTSAQQLTVPIPSGSLTVPGSYPVLVTNTDVVAPAPSTAGVNIAVQPAASTIPTAPSGSFSVGASPSSIAIDPTLGVAVIANTGDNTVSIVNLATNANVPGSPVAVGNGPTGVAVDDQLPDHIAVVTNSADNSVSSIDLTTLAVNTEVLPNPNAPPLAQPIPWAIGIDSYTHQAIVALQSSNFAWIVDFSTGVPAANPKQIGGTLTPFSTGLNPTVAVDEKLNWAVVTPGGLGSVSIVDLGRLPGTGANSADLGRPAAVIAALTASTTIRGVGINQQTHTALLADPTGPSNTIVGPALSAFSLMDQTIGSVAFTQNNLPFTQLGLTAAGVSSLSNVGIAVNNSANNGYVVDLQNNTVLQSVGGFNGPVAVAVDEATNKAYVLNQGNSTVSIVSLGASFNPLQVTSTNPSSTFVEATPAPVTMTVTGFGFVAGSTVYLDGAPLATNFVNGRELTAIVPAANVSAARRYIIYVKNGAAISNLSDLTVIQPVAVGTNPIGVAVDPNLDQAVVTNSGSDSVSVVNLLNGALITPQAPSFFSTGTTPVGVAIMARTGLAVVSNYGSNNATIIDEKGVSGTFEVPQTVALCAVCSNPLGVAVDQDSGEGHIVSGETVSGLLDGAINTFAVNLGTTAASTLTIDQGPTALAIDPTLTLAGIAIAGQTSELEIFQLGAYSGHTVNNFQLPTGVVFDDLNQDFLVANSTVNTVVAVNPSTGVVLGSIRTGINPTSVDYNPNTATLVTSNAASNTISVLDYVCPPNPSGISPCPTTAVHSVVSAATPPPSSSVIVGPNSIAIDQRLNLAVQVDQINNRVLLVPLPQ
jgi:DNA-binding beta-propeller fold protein YncE